MVARAIPVALLCACADEGPEAPRTLQIAGTVSTAAAPVAGALVTMTLWTADSLTTNRAAALRAISDSVGRYELRLDSLPAIHFDSLQIHTLPPGCTLAVRDTLLRASDLPTAGTHTLPLRLPTARPVAYSQPGQLCAYGVHPFWGPGSYQFVLRLDSVTADSLWGRWDLKYQFGSSDDEGELRGTATPSAVALHLRSQPVWHSCLGLDLRIPLTDTGAWGPATVASGQACLPEPLTFQFVADTPFVLP
jgi:hypothetical protein